MTTPSDGAPDHDQILKFLEQAKARVEGEELSVTPAGDAVHYARERLEEALVHAHAGSELPTNARLRPIKQAMLKAVRPVTSHQRPYNEELLSAVDAIAAAMERLSQMADIQEQRSTRMQASLATTDLTVDDLVDGLRRLTDTVSDALVEVRSGLAHVVATQEVELASVRPELAAIRSKQNLVFRTAREALSSQGIEVDQLTELSRELTTGYEELYEDLEDTFRGTREDVKAKLTPYLDDITSVSGSGSVVDVGCGRGEWLELLRDAGVASYGVDINK